MRIRRAAAGKAPRSKRRDYSLTGQEAAAAVAFGLANAEWYRPPIDPDRLSVLMERTNWRAARDTALWAALMAGTGTAAFISLGNWFAVPAFAAFGALYGGSADPRWHENGHGTAFRAKWANDVVYNVAAFMLLREPTLWRWSHFRHHSDTIIVGRDAEISVPRCGRLSTVVLNYLNLVNGPKMLWLITQHAMGRIDGTTRDLVPKEDLRRVVNEARIYVAVLAGTIAWAASAGTLVPLLFVGLPSFYGAWLLWFFSITQHAGLREDVLDHRLNTRTVYMNPVFRFLYLNMNYHLEHHLFPAVPYYNLPALHEEIKTYLPTPKPSVFAAYREILHALLMQRRDPSWELPSPYCPGGYLSGSVQPPLRESQAHGGGGETEPDVSPVAQDVAAVTASTDLGPVDAMQLGEVRRVDIGPGTYALYRIDVTTFALTDGLCTHGQTHLADGHLEGCSIECPKHNGRFDVRTGEAVRRPATRPLGTYLVEVLGDRVMAYLPPARSHAVTPEPARTDGETASHCPDHQAKVQVPG